MDRFLYLQQSFPDRRDLSFHVQGSVPVCTYCRDTGRNSCQFLFCCDPGRRNRSTSLVLPTDRTDPGAMPGGTEQSPEICSGPSSDRMAWCQRTYHCGRRHVCSHLRFRYQSVLRLLPGRSGKAEADRNSGGTQKGKASEDRPALLHSSYPECDEGQHRALPGGRDHRRIYRRQGRTWLYDHLRQSGLQARLAADEHLHPLRDRHAALCSDRTDREVVSLPV